MWFLGLFIGAIIGAVGGVQGAVLGALAGAGVGWALSQKSKILSDDRVSMLESSVKLLQQRVAALERIIRLRESIETPQAKVPGDMDFAEPTPSQASDFPSAEPTVPPPLSEAPAAEPLPPQPTPPPYDVRPSAVPPDAPPPPGPLAPLWNFFFGGNTVVRFGVIVLFFGVSFLLKYASEHIVIPHRSSVGRSCAWRHGHAGDRLAPAPVASGLWLDHAGRRRRLALSYGVRRISPLSVAAARVGLRAARGARRFSPRCWPFCRTRVRSPLWGSAAVFSRRSWHPPAPAAT